MGSNSVFSIKTENIIHLSPIDSVKFFRKLLWAEANRVGISRYLIDVPECINVGDGGIDAIIEDADPNDVEVIPYGTTGFQIKSADLSPEECKKELHVNGCLDEPLKPEINRILDEGGNYILVLFADITPRKRINRRKNIRKELKQFGYDNDVRIYTASQLVEFANRHVALVCEYEQIMDGIPYSKWANQKYMQIPKTFIVDSQRENWIDHIRKELMNRQEQAQIFRVTGLSGIGKTRLVFEALNIDGIKQLVVYINADYFLTSELYWKLQREATLCAVLVVDECSVSQHDTIVRAFNGYKPGISIITISHEKGSIPHPTKLCNLEPLDNNKIQEIINTEFSSILHEVASRITRFADGYPRIAVLLGESYLKEGLTSDEVIFSPDSVLMNRLLGVSEPLTDHDRKSIRALQAISVFGKIGYKESASNEAVWLANFAKIEFSDFQEIIHEQRNRGIVQGQYYLYISPLILQIHLLSEWWETYGLGSEDEFNQFFENIPEEIQHDLLERFLDQLPYAGATEQGREFAAVILESELFLENNGEFLKSEIGSRFFLKLSDANLISALSLLEETVGKWSDNELMDFKVGRRNIVWALKKMVTYKVTFIKGSKILLRLAENENEQYSNNATGIFSSLFTPVSGELSLTEAPPSMRMPILVEALKSSKPETRNIAINACDKGLETRGFSRMIENPIANLRREPKRWTAETYGEIFDVYQEIWNLLVNIVKKPQSKKEQVTALKALINHSIEISQISYLSELVISTFEELAEIKTLKTFLLEAIIRFLRYGSANIDPEIKSRWVILQEKLTGTGYKDLLHRYVGTNLFEEQYDKDGKPTNILKIQLTELVDYSILHKDKFTDELLWLLSDKAINGHFFGYLLFQKDEDLKLLPSILEMIHKIKGKVNLGLLGGYLRALHEKDTQLWEKQLEKLSDDPNLLPYLPEITARSGVSDNALDRIIQFVKEERLPCDSLGALSSFREIRDLSKDVFIRWIQLLLRENVPNKYEIALRNMYLYFIYEKERTNLPVDLTFSLITFPFTEGNQELQNNVMVDYYWQEISKKFISQYPDKQISLLEIILNYYSTNVSLSTLPHSEPFGIMNHILKKRPKEAWELIINILDNDDHMGKFNICKWLRGEKYTFGREQRIFPITLIPSNLIWKWIDTNISENAKVIASIVPNEFSNNEEYGYLTRQLLIKYGDREDVREALIANFFFESWSGLSSKHYLNKKDLIIKFKKDETNNNVLLWLNEYISALDSSIKRALLHEEREGY